MSRECRTNVSLTAYPGGVMALSVALSDRPVSMSVPLEAGATPAQLAERLEALAGWLRTTAQGMVR